MNKNILITLLLIAVFALIIVFFGKRDEEVGFFETSPTPTPSPTSGSIPSPTPTPTSTPTLTLTPTLTPTSTPVLSKTIVINMTDSGFTPSEVSINAGDTVRFVNQSSLSRWPASAIHPIHELYPGSSIIKCQTTEADSIFDACRGLNQGESFSFIFAVKGTWPYHDHLQSSMTGRIVVK